MLIIQRWDWDIILIVNIKNVQMSPYSRLELDP